MGERCATSPSSRDPRQRPRLLRDASGTCAATRVRYGDGEIVRQYVDHPGAAAIVAVDDEQRVLLIQQYRHPIRHRDWEIPAGLLDIAGETPLETAQRELDRGGRSHRPPTGSRS